jgi:hypothetical protein
VQLERLAVQLRPRGAWEAMDLGLTMTRTWLRSAWGAWLAVYFPAALAFGLVFHERPWIGALLLWWLKPVFDRFVLHVLGRAVFGVPPGAREALGAWRDLMQPGLLASLTLYRLHPARSFVLPVWQLERQSGAAARARREGLQKRLWGHAVWLTVICVHFEAAVLLSMGSVIDLLVPAKTDSAFDPARLFSADGGVALWTWADTVAYAIAVSLIEPIYVAAGFALYLDRRMRLEGWDVEVGLRRLAQRLGHSAGVAGAALAIALGAATPDARATASPKEEIARVLEAPEFQTQREITTWRYRGEARKDDVKTDRELWARIGQILSQITQIIGWAALGALVVAAAWFAQRLLPAMDEAGDRPAGPAAPALERWARQETLPHDLPEAAAALARAGRVREALSLLYRGALAALAAYHGLDLQQGDTETDSLRRSEAVLSAEAKSYFVAVVQGWQRAAYSAQPPARESALELCESWSRHFSAPAATGQA